MRCSQFHVQSIFEHIECSTTWGSPMMMTRCQQNCKSLEATPFKSEVPDTADPRVPSLALTGSAVLETSTVRWDPESQPHRSQPPES